MHKRQFISFFRRVLLSVLKIPESALENVQDLLSTPFLLSNQRYIWQK